MSALFYLYRNLNTGTFSLQYKGKVIEHPESIVMHNVTFKVSEKGRQRVLARKVKNVHARCGATRIEPIKVRPQHSELKEIYYCPYQTPQFIVKETGEPIFEADCVVGMDNKVFLCVSGKERTQDTLF